MSVKNGLIAGLAVLALTACTPAVNTSPNRLVQVFSTTDLGPTGKRRFQEFKRDTDFYGAFYVSPNGLGGGRIGAGRSLADAKQLAKATCEVFSAENGDGAACILYATIEPADPSATDGLPLAAYTAFQGARSQTEADRVAALAMNAQGEYAVAGNAVSRKEAERVATERCNAATAKTRSNERREVAKAKSRISAYDCRVVATDN